MILITSCVLVLQDALVVTFSTHFYIKYSMLNTKTVLLLAPLLLVLSKRASVRTHRIFNDGVTKVRAVLLFQF